MNEQEIKNRMTAIEIELGRLSDERNQLRKQLAEIVSPFKVGDWIQGGDGNHVYVVDDIKLHHGSTEFIGNHGSIEFIGRKIKNNGAPGLRSGVLYDLGNRGFIKVKDKMK